MIRTGMLLLYMLLFVQAVVAQVSRRDSIGKAEDLEEVVISANKFAERKKNIAQKIEVVNAARIAEVNAQNTGDLLMNTGKVFVQKSQQGGSSPVIRGFEASRVLLVVDGVRLNNAIFRAGHLQNVITIDQNMLERVEILYGPASSIYGTDALGGVVHMRTKTPKFGEQGKANVKATAFTRYSTANDEKTIHANFNLGFDRIAFVTSITRSDFGDVRMGSQFPSRYPDFCRRSFYIKKVQGVDSVVKNENSLVQKYSGYRQWDLLQKIAFRQNDHITHSLNFQYSNSTNVPRYDRLQDIRNGNLRFAEWYYGPQRRTMLAYEVSASNLASFFDEAKLNVSLQDIKESRHQREYRRVDLDNRLEHIKVLGYSLDGRRRWGKNELNLGIDGQYNNLQSTAFRQNTASGAKTRIDSRYPDGDNRLNSVGIYAQHLLKIVPEKLILNDGIRFQYVSLHSTLVDTAVQLHLPYTNIRQENQAVTGNVGLVYLPRSHTKFSVMLASGFRNPNIDDLSRIFESSTQLRQLVVPNPDIKPEYTYNIDLSAAHRFGGIVDVSVTGFYTWFRNAIVLAPFRLNGQDSIEYNGVQSAILANQNRNKAFLYGGNINVDARLSTELTLSGTLSYTYGRFEVDPSTRSNIYRRLPDGSYARVSEGVSQKPLDHVPPLFGRVSARYQKEKWNGECFILFNGRKHISDFNADGEDNAQYATNEGMPAWYTLNIRGQYDFTRNIRLQLALENILDRNYRHFASGFSASGRNLVLSLRVAI